MSFGSKNISSLFSRRWFWPATLVLFSVVSRLPVVAHQLTSWDAVQYALGLGDFDLSQHQPHPPGSPLFILAGRALNALWSDPRLSLLALDVLFSAAAVLVFFALVERLTGDRRFAGWASLILAATPYVWMYGATVSIYPVDLFFSILFAYLALRAVTGGGPWLSALTLALTVGAGFRPSLLPLFFPLWAYAGWVRLRHSNARGRRVLQQIGLGFLGLAFWFVPMVLDTGGQQYLDLTRDQFDRVQLTVRTAYGGYGAILLHNLAGLLTTIFESLNILLPLTLAVWWIQRSLHQVNPSPTTAARYWTRILGFWLVPSLGLYLFGHLGHAGYLMTVIAGLLLWVLLPLQNIFRRQPRLAAIMFTGVVCLEVMVFLFGSASDGRSATAGLTFPWPVTHSRAAIQAADRRVVRMTDSLRQFPSSQTLVAVAQPSEGQAQPGKTAPKEIHYWYRILGYAMPDYRIVQLYGGEPHWSAMQERVQEPRVWSSEVRAGPGVTTVVLIPDLDGKAAAPAPRVFTVEPGQPLRYGRYTFVRSMTGN